MTVEEVAQDLLRDQRFYAILKESKNGTSMTKLELHLSQPENRIRYAYEFMNTYKGDDKMVQLAQLQAYEWVALADNEESHY